MEFLHTLVAFLAAHNVLPPEVTASDTNRSKTFLQYLPDEPSKVYMVRWYDTSLPALVNKQAGVYRIQVVMRNPNHAEVLREITALWTFLINRPEPIEDIGNGFYAIFDCRSGPVEIGKDDHGNYRYSLNFPVKSKTF